MGKTKNQHYVPRMYIKRFGYGTEDNPRISVLKKQEGIVLHNQNPENFASRRFFYDTTEDVIENILKKDIEVFPSIRESEFYHDEQLTEHALSRLEGAYRILLDSIEANPPIIYEDEVRARFICFVHELAYRTRSFRDGIDAISSKTEEVLSRHMAIVMRVKDKKAPMVSGDKSKDYIINMSIKGVIAYNMMQVSMAQLYLFGSEKAINFIKILYNMREK